jgi:uncharacterized membrane protein
MTSALVGGISFSAFAGELTPAQTGSSAAAPAAQQPSSQARESSPTQASEPAMAPAPKAAKSTPAPHRLARAAPRVTPQPVIAEPIAVQREVRVASSSASAFVLLGIAY